MTSLTKEQLEAIRGKGPRWLTDRLTEAVVESLHYLGNIERINTLTTAAEASAALEGGKVAYRTDPVFHAKVQSMLSAIYTAIDLDTFMDLANEVDRLTAENERLRAALTNAADDIESWGAYASEYFQNKWNLQGDIDEAREALEKP